MHAPVMAPTSAPTGPKTAPASPPKAAPVTPFSNFASFRLSGQSGARVLPFQRRAVRVILLLFLLLQVIHAANRLFG
jgi:hypothetical protein